MVKMSEREFKIWEVFLTREWDKPDRHDWYLMQIAALIDSFLSQKHVSPSEKKLQFSITGDSRSKGVEEMTEEEIQQWANDMSNMRLGQLQFQSARASSNNGQ